LRLLARIIARHHLGLLKKGCTQAEEHSGEAEYGSET
jgi:hypothetical protein